MTLRTRLQLLRRLMWLEAATGNCEHAMMVAGDVARTPPVSPLAIDTERPNGVAPRSRARRTPGAGALVHCATAEAALVGAACSARGGGGDDGAIEGNRTLVLLACASDEQFVESDILSVLRVFSRT